MKKDAFSHLSFASIGYRALVWGSALFILAVLQTTAAARLALFSATPDLMLAAVICLAMHEGERVGAVAGIASGVLYVSLGATSPLYILFSFAAGYIFGIISSLSLSKNLPSFIALVSAAYLAKAIFNVIDVSLFSDGFNLITTLTRAILPELLCSLVFCVPVYLVFLPLIRIFNKNRSSRKDRLTNEHR